MPATPNLRWGLWGEAIGVKQLDMQPELRLWKSYLALLLFCLVLYGSGLTALPPVDRDEARFAQATRQMFEDQDFVRIRFQSEPRNKKPIGIYWLQAAAVALAGKSAADEIWPYRLPSLLGATLAVLMTLAYGARLFDLATGRWAAWLAASSLLLTVEAHLATTDAMLLASLVAAQGALGSYYVGTQRAQPIGIGTVVIFWAAQGVALLLKGPVVAWISLLTMGALSAADRSVRWLKGLRFGLGLALVTVMVSPWAIAIGLATHGDFFHDALASDLLPKLVSGVESHGFPPGYYLLLLPVTFWPASLFVGLGLHGAWKHRLEAGERFCLAWIVPAWVVFELIPTKLPHYVLPTYPALALLSARTIVTGGPEVLARIRSKWARLGFFGWIVIGLGLAAAIVALPLWVERRFEPWTLVPALAASGSSLLAVSQVVAGRLRRAGIVVLVGAAVTMVPLLHTILPSMNGLWLSRSVERAIQRHVSTTPGAELAVAASGYSEPSLVFLFGTSMKFLPPEEAAEYLHDHSTALVVISDAVDAEFQGKLAKLQQPVRVLQTIKGFNYSKGKWLTLRLYAAP
jgi:4-amino-4-deoxy-L-arabinose transferase-like glycosyltransferase